MFSPKCIFCEIYSWKYLNELGYGHIFYGSHYGGIYYYYDYTGLFWLYGSYIPMFPIQIETLLFRHPPLLNLNIMNISFALIAFQIMRLYETNWTGNIVMVFVCTFPSFCIQKYQNTSFEIFIMAWQKKS